MPDYTFAITEKYLKEHPNEIFVYGDNTLHKGHGGAAKLRDLPNTYGFITKRWPTMEERAFFTPEEYIHIFLEELQKLCRCIKMQEHEGKIWLIARIGGNLANKNHIFEEIIQKGIRILDIYPNVKFLWDN